VTRAVRAVALGFAAGVGFVAALAGTLLAADAWADRRERSARHGVPDRWRAARPARPRRATGEQATAHGPLEQAAHRLDLGPARPAAAGERHGDRTCRGRPPADQPDEGRQQVGRIVRRGGLGDRLVTGGARQRHARIMHAVDNP
jgi:hypothetical protein